MVTATRKERRAEQGKDFTPQYNGPVPVRTKPEKLMKYELRQAKRAERKKAEAKRKNRKKRI